MAAGIAEKADGVLPPSTKAMAQIVASATAIEQVISDYRIFARMWGLLGLYAWARATCHDPLPVNAGRQETILRGLTWASVVSSVAFQVLENGAYLSSKGALTTDRWTGAAGKARETQWWLWSSRFWAAYVGMEILRLAILRYYREPAPTALVGGDGEKEDKMSMEESIKAAKQENWVWWKDLTSNVALAPMTIHFSMEQGLLSNAGMGICGTVAGVALLIDAWARTA
ncbi:uncharacterized protein SETTUDRAFT_116160 [Exserohilum turcica Et28A]|uniref:Uncharacterized protein n=1 Tax=Exserohilum turcicum (strain 28A) TaxID=671987 RepID=R0KD37_EXST2|nr:uncharacterized protein SETTUDRAFT_116160 [Exserohilum turcica Et28A]EOA87294.1 hypothetical protein SETTUDRAFT_116160 [Exserohilum turcica Et28A]